MHIAVEFRKWPRAAHYTFETTRLGEDAHGTWLGGEAGTPWTCGPTRSGQFTHPFVILIPRQGWWAAIWHPEPDPIELYVDINAPAQWTDDRVVLIDLDLDIVRMRDGTVRLVDEDEFEANRTALAYPDALIQGATAAAPPLMDAVRARQEPFGDAERWFSRL